MSTLNLGGVDFDVNELPEKLNLGGEQTIAIRKFPGGGIDVQTLGAFEDQITWEGTFWFQGALDKAQKLDNMRITGNNVQLIVSTLTRNVIINKFTYDYINDYYISYSITLQPSDTFGLSTNSVNEITNNTSQTQTTDATIATSEQTQQNQASYTVTSGDTLWGLAAKYYGDGSQYPKIAEANNIQNPNLISIGTQLVIPNPTQGVA